MPDMPVHFSPLSAIPPGIHMPPIIVQMTAPDTFHEIDRSSTAPIITGIGDEQVRHPRSILGVWSDHDLNVIGIWRVERAMPPEGEIIARYHFAMQGGRVVQVIDETAPAPRPSMPIISDRQFFQALAMKGVITEDEALAAVQTGTIPALMEQIVDAIPDPEQQFAARMLLSGATQFERDHPLVETFGAALGWPPDEIDELWLKAASL